MATPNLGITYIQAAQNQKEVTANAAFLAFDEALFQPTKIALTDADFFAAGGGSPAVTNLAFLFTGTLSDNRNVFLPTTPKMYLVNNSTVVGNQSPVVTGKTLTFKVPDGSPAVFGRTVTILANSGYHLLYCDGGNVDEIQVSQENANISLAPGDANFILPTATALGYAALVFTGSFSANRAILLPSMAKFYLIKNSTGRTLTFEIPSLGSPATFGRTVDVTPTGLFVGIYTDGVNVDAVTAIATAGVGTTTIGSGTASLGTSAIGSGAAATVVTVSAPGVLASDTLMADFAADPTGVTGYAPSASGMLTIVKYPTANNVNFKVINNTSGSITPGAITLNWRVVR